METIEIENSGITINTYDECISIEEFNPELFDCDSDGSCGSGHIHICK